MEHAAMTKLEVQQRPVHLSGYQARDYEIVDYAMDVLPETGLSFRGPFDRAITAGEPYFTCLGAAQTLGCFCETPYPEIVAEALGIPALNLGYGGAGPEFFLKQTSLLRYINQSQFVILQVMSGRSQGNSYYQCGGLELVTLSESGESLGAAGAFKKLLAGPAFLRTLPAPQRVRNKLANLAARPRARTVVGEIREKWVRSNLALLEAVTVPVIVLWFSKRRPNYVESYATHSQLFGEFPHLINEDMLKPIRERAAGYVEAVTDRGSPQPLFSRFTGRPTSVNPSNDRPDLAVPDWTVNHYYPSPEMHEDAAAALLSDPALKRFMANP
jgi:hypothetical protein